MPDRGTIMRRRAARVASRPAPVFCPRPPGRALSAAPRASRRRACGIRLRKCHWTALTVTNRRCRLVRPSAASAATRSSLAVGDSRPDKSRRSRRGRAPAATRRSATGNEAYLFAGAQDARLLMIRKQRRLAIVPGRAVVQYELHREPAWVIVVVDRQISRGRTASQPFTGCMSCAVRPPAAPPRPRRRCGLFWRR